MTARTTTRKATTRYRVACSEFSSSTTFASAEGARRRMIDIESLDECQELHTVEVLTESGEWVALHKAIAAAILAAKLGAEVETFDGTMKVNSGGWSKETAARADATAEVGSSAWVTALGAHEWATVTSDAGTAWVTAWCQCQGAGIDEWVRYERWTAEGRVAHGFVHDACRKLTQTG